MFPLALIAFFSLIAMYIALAITIVYHVKKFDVDDKTAKRAILLFSSISFLLIVFATFVFFNISWETLL